MGQVIERPQAQTMSSREIAALVDKRHGNVIRDIRDMLDSIHDDSKMSYQEIQGVSVEHCPQTGRVKAFHLDRYHTEVLVTGYDVHRRAAVIRRWMELERQAAQPADPMQVLSDPAAMRGLLLTYTEKVLALESELEEQAPKVQAHQRIANTEGAISLREAAKTLQVSPSFLIDYMLERRWLYRMGVRGRLQAFQPRLDRGQLRHKANRDGHMPQVLVTMKGVARLGELIAQEESAGQVIHAHFGAYRRQEALL